MKHIVHEKLEAGRVRQGEWRSPVGKIWGAFFIMGPSGRQLKIISSGIDYEYGWEHVSVSIEGRTPNWEEMCWVKNLFWDEDECVVQYHPAKKHYVNHHPFCLHLWRPIAGELPVPPPILVGPKGE